MLGAVVDCGGVVLTRIARMRIVEQSFVWDNLAIQRQLRDAIIAGQCRRG